MILNTSDLVLLRTRPQRTQLSLSIYQPTTLFAARANLTGTFSKGSMTISYQNVTTGSYGSVLPNGTLLVGSAPGLQDLGKVRLKSADASNLYVAENSDVLWSSGVYLTEQNYVDLWPIYPLMVQDSTGVNVIFFKDTNIAYTNQNSVLGTFVCMGPHRAAYRDPASGIAPLYYSSSGSYNVKGDPLVWAWQFEGGTPSYYSGTGDPGWINYSTPGHYKTTATAFNTSGTAQDTGYRFVSIYDRPGVGTNIPIEHWELTTPPAGSRAEGGYTARIKVYDDLTSVQDGALVVLFADDWYGNTKKSLGGNSLNNESIVFVGYIQKDTITYDYKEKWAEFDVGSITMTMKNTLNFAVSCQSVVTPKTWFQLPSMTPPIALYHYIHWHSTLDRIADFVYTGPVWNHQYFDTDRVGLYDAINKFLNSAIVGELVADRQGKIWAEKKASAIHNSPTTVPISQPIIKQDWMGQPSVEEQPLPITSYMEYGGIAYFGPSSNTFSAYLACAPGISPAYRGNVASLEGLILTDQIQLNQLVGDVFAYTNQRYTVSLNLAGNYRNLDIAPIEQLTMNISPSDTIRGLSFVNSPFHITEMSWDYKGEVGSFLPKIKTSQLTIGVPGDTIVIPPAPPPAGFTVPNFVLPTIPAWAFPTWGVPGTGPKTVVIMDSVKGLWYTDNFDSAYPQWWSLNGGANTAGIIRIALSYSRTVYGINKINGIFTGQLGAGGVANTFPYTWAFSKYGGYDVVFSAMGLLNKSDVLAVVLGRYNTIGPISDFWYGSPYGLTKKGSGYYTHGVATKLLYGGGKWMYVYTSGLGGNTTLIDRYNSDGSVLEADQGFGSPGGFDCPSCKPDASSKLFVTQADGLYMSPDNIAVSPYITKIFSTAVLIPRCDPTGGYLFGKISGVIKRSSDGGINWGTVPALTGGATTIINAGDGNKWIADLNYTDDFGDTWYDKTGNLTSFIPSPSIIDIDYLP